MKNVRVLSLFLVCCISMSANADNAAAPPAPIGSGMCNPFIIDMANIGKVSVATYLAMSSVYGPRVVARLGSFVGSTPLMGATLIGFLGSQAAAELLNKYVFYGNTESDEIARFGTYTGAIVGTAVSVGTIIAAASAAPVTTVAAAGAATSTAAVARAATDALITPVVAALMFGVLAYQTNCMLSE